MVCLHWTAILDQPCLCWHAWFPPISSTVLEMPDLPQWHASGMKLAVCWCKGHSSSLIPVRQEIYSNQSVTVGFAFSLVRLRLGDLLNFGPYTVTLLLTSDPICTHAQQGRWETSHGVHYTLTQNSVISLVSYCELIFSGILWFICAVHSRPNLNGKDITVDINRKPHTKVARFGGEAVRQTGSVVGGFSPNFSWLPLIANDLTL